LSSLDPVPAPRAVILGCAGPELGPAEAAFFREADPCGFILFQRNCQTPAQIRELIGVLRETVGRPDAAVLIDQEGGRVQRLKPPQWRAAPPARLFALLAAEDPAAARRATWISNRLIADDLSALGITVDCTPVLDNPVPGAHDVIGDRAWGADTATIADLGRAVCDGLMAGGVLPVIKHIPGHGRSSVDSHHDCPVVTASSAELEATDLPPFKALADQPFAMTAHIVYTAWDEARVATMSPVVIQGIIREKIGFDGVLMSDDLSMKALGGDFGNRARLSLEAGCDVVLHCNGDPAEMAAIVAETGILAGEAARRWAAALAVRRMPQPIDRPALTEELDRLLAGVKGRT
jgi:beta-N-acetylhexosaminidase